MIIRSAIEGAVEAPSVSFVPESAPSSPAIKHDWPAPDPPKPNPQWKRLTFHVIGITLAAYLCRVIEDPYWRGGLCIFALTLAVAYEVGRKFKNNWFGRLCNRAQVRDHEVDTRAASTDFGLAMALVAMFFPPAVAATAFLVAAYADPLARLWGMRFGRLRWFGGKKTVEGSMACLAVAAVVVFATCPGLPFWSGMAVAIVAVAAELIPQTHVDTRLGRLLTPCDNFYLPLGTALALAALT